MKTIISGRNIQLTDAIKSTIQEKVQKINEHYDFVKEVHVFLSVEKNPSIANAHLAEATVHVNGATLKLEVSSHDLYASIDGLVDKIDAGLRRYKTKLLQRTKSARSSGGESIRHIGDLEDNLRDPDLATMEDDDGVLIAPDEGVWITGALVEPLIESRPPARVANG